MKQILIELKGKTDKYTTIIRDFNSLPKTGRTARQEISKDMEDLNTIKQHTLIDKYKTLDPTTAEYTFFPQVSMEHVLR